MIFKIKDLCEVKRGSSPRPILDYLSEAGYKWLKISDFNFKDRYVYETKEFIKKEGLNGTKLVKKGTLILTNSATPGIPIFLGEDMCLHDGFLYFLDVDSKVNINYLFYWFQNYRSSLVNKANGSVFKNLKKEIVENLDIDLPDKKMQDKSVSILDSIDSKIENNKKIINNINNQINILFKKIFNNFEEYKALDEISDVTIGKTPPRANAECFSTDINDAKWISISDLVKSGMYVYDTAEKLTQESIDKYNVRTIPANTIVLSFKLTIGKVGITTETMATNEAIAHFNLKNKKMRNYLYYTLLNYNYNNLGNTSSIGKAINSKIVKGMKIGIPKDDELDRFNSITDDMFELIKNKELEIIKLSEMRDTLLPKLMDGEIDLVNIEI